MLQEKCFFLKKKEIIPMVVGACKQWHVVEVGMIVA